MLCTMQQPERNQSVFIRFLFQKHNRLTAMPKLVVSQMMFQERMGIIPSVFIIVDPPAQAGGIHKNFSD